MASSPRILLVMAIAALLGAPAGAQQAPEAKTCPADLPGPVAAKRDAILAAAKAKDHLRLSELADKRDFEFNFSSKDFRVNHWRGGGKGDPDSAGAALRVLQMACAVETIAGGLQVFHWPSAAIVPRARLSATEREELAAFYGDKLEAQWVDGRFEGWRARIDGTGRWLTFINGY